MTTLTSSIACLTVTHNRVSLLKRAIHCFNKQAYPNKELVVLFTNEDTETAAFASANPQYKKMNLIQRDSSKNIFICSARDRLKKNDQWVLGEPVYLLSNDNEYLMISGDGTFEWDKKGTAQHAFEWVMVENSYYLKTPSGRWLFMDSNGFFSESDIQLPSHRMETILMIDGRIKLLSAESVTTHTKMQLLGFDVEVVKEGSSKISFVELFPSEEITLGGKRNLTIEVASSDYICVWDDDDWYAENRLLHQLLFMEFTQKSACTLATTILFDHFSHKGYFNVPRATGWEQTLLCAKQEMHYYTNLNVGEDSAILTTLALQNKIAVMQAPDLYIYNIHASNTCPNSHFYKMINNPEAVMLPEQKNNEIMALLEG